MIFKILMMLKNEDDLLLPWLEFHGKIYGYENLYIFDNGSTSQVVADILSNAIKKGAHVDLSRASSDDFLWKGEIFKVLIQDLDEKDPADFYFPLDCDEFLGVQIDDLPAKFDKESLEDALKPFIDFQGALAIRAGYGNNPVVEGEFFESVDQQKTFFARGACDALDHGFHVGVGKLPGDAVRTPVIYLHYHYKPFRILQDHARQKLEHFTNDFSEEGLHHYREEKNPGFHVVGHLLLDESAYYRSMSHISYVRLDNFIQAFRIIGIPPPFST